MFRAEIIRTTKRRDLQKDSELLIYPFFSGFPKTLIGEILHNFKTNLYVFNYSNRLNRHLENDLYHQILA